ncbi:MAG: putative rane protein, partial [Gemmatimonadetes bacterium]|nr:putative rane protein [Gemmatimonadota bacterium]
MNATGPRERPPYRAALIVFLIVLTGYLVSLAPTVTFWDAGEFIAATKILGIPHPPGTPLFVLMGHVWATLLPIGAWAYRTNLLSASFSATAAGMWFLVVHESLKGAQGAEGGGDRVRLPGAAAAAIIGAFSFTNWQ